MFSKSNLPNPQDAHHVHLLPLHQTFLPPLSSCYTPPLHSYHLLLLLPCTTITTTLTIPLYITSTFFHLEVWASTGHAHLGICQFLAICITHNNAIHYFILPHQRNVDTVSCSNSSKWHVSLQMSQDWITYKFQNNRLFVEKEYNSF